MAKVFIKLSVTIEIVDDRERVLATGRFGADKTGYAAMRNHVSAWPERTWAGREVSGRNTWIPTGMTGQRSAVTIPPWKTGRQDAVAADRQAGVVVQVANHGGRVVVGGHAPRTEDVVGVVTLASFSARGPSAVRYKG
jgi:hypothetical protein